MSRSTFYGLEIGKTGLFVSQNQLDTTGHNMSNASTVGYTRQRVSTEALPPAVGTKFVAEDIRATSGRGVSTINIDQVRNPFLDYQYRKENSQTSCLSTKEQYFTYAESLFNNELDEMDKSTGLMNVFKGFYNSLYTLTEAPADQEMRANVKENAIKLTQSFNYYYSKLMEQQDTLNESVRVSVIEINEISNQIAELNKQIYTFEVNGAKANDLRDKRNLLLDNLSGIVKIDTYEDINGQLVVRTGGRTLIHHGSASQLAVNKDFTNPIEGEPNLYGVYWADAEGNPTPAALTIEGGALKGYLAIRDGNSDYEVGIPRIMKLLDGVVEKVVKQVNEVHRKGYNIPTPTETTRNGIDFFDPNSLRAKDMKVSSDIMTSVMNIAVSDMPVSVNGEANDQKGNNKIALELVGLITKTDAEGKPDNLNSIYKEMLNTISLELNNIHNNTDTQTLMLSHIDDQRASISNVSIDEEMTNLIRFNHAYKAASRVITTMDEGLDVIINQMGKVGR